MKKDILQEIRLYASYKSLINWHESYSFLEKKATFAIVKIENSLE
jgi:hypothetical protein